MVSSAYAIEATLRALFGDLSPPLPTLALALGLVVLVTADYRPLVARFSKDGGASAAAGRVFGYR
ncbi:hypothetical protein AB0D12_33000 [Streptomyces sp. NPDC048479]|uniref:hypothetical protein n=1 Tax=Streptomyces sp. NPDC048479 TaxID=3154725 RepID=UPI003447FC40